jgi:hypothetical protein
VIARYQDVASAWQLKDMQFKEYSEKGVVKSHWFVLTNFALLRFYHSDADSICIGGEYTFRRMKDIKASGSDKI